VYVLTNFSFLIYELDGPDKSIIIHAAERIDEYLANYSVSSEDQGKPYIGLPIQPMYIKAGQRFTIKLRGHSNLHNVKLSEIEDPSLAIQVANGSASGEYPFFAMKAGKTKIRLLVAHATLLTVAFQDVDVKIEKGTAGNEESSESIMTLPVASQRPLRLLSLDNNAITGLTSLTILQRIFRQLAGRFQRAV
jgi:hypothetical protein